MVVNQTFNGTAVHFQTAALIAPDGTSEWNELPGSPFWFAGTQMSTQGIRGRGLFVGTKLDGSDVHRSDFTSLPSDPDPGYLIDQSFCMDGFCRSVSPLDHRRYWRRYDGSFWVEVHEAGGHAFNQDRHIYTTDPFEAQTSGLRQQVTAKLLASIGGGDNR